MVAGTGASSSVGQSTRLISVGSEVQVLPGPFAFVRCGARKQSPGGTRRLVRGPGSHASLFAGLGRQPSCDCDGCARFVRLRGRSSAGRAPALQAGGRRFESGRLHCPPRSCAAAPRRAISPRGVPAEGCLACRLVRTAASKISVRSWRDPLGRRGRAACSFTGEDGNGWYE